jgi:SNF2 family DNA or RNA helicase
MNRRPFQPHKGQALIAEHVFSADRVAIWAGMGIGKTAPVLTALHHLSLVQDGPSLVIGPLRVVKSTWPQEASKWDHLVDLEVSAVVGTVEERRAALRRPASVYTINFENLPWLVEEYGIAWPFKTVVVDESTRLKGFRLRQGSSRAGALAQVAHKRVQRFIELTGTPAANGLQDLWGQCWFLDRGDRLGRTYDAFISRWFQSVRVGSDPHAVQFKPLHHAQAEIESRLKDICLSLDPRDFFDIAEPIVNIIRVDLPPKARKLYRDMEREMYAQIGHHGVEAFSAASRTMKCLQLANGAAYVNDEGAWTDVHDAKLQALESVIEEAAGMPVLVAYHFKSDLARLQRAFPKGRVLDTDSQTIIDWNAGRIPVLFAHPASAGHGLNLQDGGNILVFFGHWWSLEEHQQIIERIGPTRQAQAGHDRAVFIHHLIATDTVDELILKRLETKREVQDLLLEAMKS